MGQKAETIHTGNDQLVISDAQIIPFPTRATTPRWYEEAITRLESDSVTPDHAPGTAVSTTSFEPYRQARELSQTGIQHDHGQDTDARVISMLPLLATKRRIEQAPIRAAAFWDLTKYVLHQYNVTQDRLDDDRTHSAMRLLWSAKKIVSPDTPVLYLDPDDKPYNLHSSNVGRDRIAQLVNPTTLDKIARSPHTRPWLEELGKFVIDPNTYEPPKAPPMSAPILRPVQ
jgi:hypothetical protein